MKRLIIALLSVAMMVLGAGAANAQTGDVGYSAGNVHLGTAGQPRQQLSYSVVDRGYYDDGTVFYDNVSAGVSYTAHVTNVRVVGHTTRFSYGALGVIVVWRLVDRPGLPDLAGFSVASTPAQAAAMVRDGFMPTNSYPVTYGNLVVNRTTSYGLRGMAYGDVEFGAPAPVQRMAFVVFDYGYRGDKGVVFYENLTARIGYQASSSPVWVYRNTARFAYQIRTGPLAGTIVVWRVADGGRMFPDRTGFSTAPSLGRAAAMVNFGFTPANNYLVTAGNLVVRR